MILYGTYEKDGSVKEKPTHCILSKKPLHGAVVTGHVKGTNRFYCYLAKYSNRVTPELRQEWQSGSVGKKDK